MAPPSPDKVLTYERLRILYGKDERNLTLDERAKISRLQGDLLWLVREGYVKEGSRIRMGGCVLEMRARTEEHYAVLCEEEGYSLDVGERANRIDPFLGDDDNAAG